MRRRFEIRPPPYGSRGLNYKTALATQALTLSLSKGEAIEGVRAGRTSWFDTLTMRSKSLKSLGLILSLSKDGAANSAFSAAC
jgi:hypothetical protein